ncbi:MAG: hypothetical protein ACR5LD_07625 [Symbiopectobacterium sp.]
MQTASERSGARIILQVNSDYLTLARCCTSWDEIVVRGNLLPYFDYHCELMNLPMALWACN